MKHDNEPPLPPEAEKEFLAIEKRYSKELGEWLKRWPDFRRHCAYGILGTYIAFADHVGCDVEGFLAQLRRRVREAEGS